MKRALKISLFILATALTAMAFVWTFAWMPAAFQNTDPAIHDQVRYGYIHGAVMACLALTSFVVARRITPNQITRGTT